ncbi:MAG: TlpA family protein disulfide reductase [Muribaculaceae bacterium]|nr:TlpA family protein disulfide reductase [Muribaculaceae bacterium]
MTGISNITERMENIKLTWEGQPFIDLEGRSIDGKPVKLSDFLGKGKYIIADFWASWCGGCIIEAREILLPLYNEYKENPDVQFIGIAFDDVKETVEKLELPWEQIISCENAMYIYSTYSIPEIVIFAPDGTILHRRLHGNETANKLHQILDTLNEP